MLRGQQMHVNEEPRPGLWICIPARLNSTRLQEKLLLPWLGHSILWHVCKSTATFAKVFKESNAAAFSFIRVILVCDHEKLLEQGINAGVDGVLTPSTLVSGTERVRYGLSLLKQDSSCHSIPRAHDYVLNIQGDEPLFSYEDFSKLLIETLSKKQSMATLVVENNSLNQFLSTSVVKVVLNKEKKALYFSRSPIPWPRSLFGAKSSVPQELQDFIIHNQDNETDYVMPEPFLRHVGTYLYTWRHLNWICDCSLDQGDYEFTEGLEQLRVLVNGQEIFCVKGSHAPLGIDTHSDYQRLIASGHCPAYLKENEL